MSLFEGLESDAHFFLVRHGESAGNREGRIQGHTDLPLTDKGRGHARQAGNWLSRHPIGMVCTSPLARAHETADIIAEACGMGMGGARRLENLKELDTGVFSNRTFTDIKREDPELFEAFHAESWSAVPGAESIGSMTERCRIHWSYLIEEANKGMTHSVTVSHYGMIQWLFKITFASVFDTWMPLISVGNCAVFHLHVSPRVGKSGTAWYQEWRLVNYLPWMPLHHDVADGKPQNLTRGRQEL